MRKVFILLLFIQYYGQPANAQDTLQTCWTGKFNIAKYKGYIEFKRFLTEKNDSLYFLVNWEMFEKGMYINAVPATNEKTNEINQVNITPLKHTDKESIELLGIQHVTENLFLGNNLILIFRKEIKDLYVFHFFLYDLNGNCVKERKIELPVYAKKTAPYEKIVFSPDGKQLLFHYRCKQKDGNPFDKIMVMNTNLETVSEADNLFSFWDPENDFFKYQENIMVNLQTSITNSGYVIIRHARYKLGVITERSEGIYSPGKFNKIPFEPDLEGYMLRGDLQVMDDANSNLSVIGSYGTNDQIKGIFTCKIKIGEIKIRQLKLIPFEEKTLSLSPATDNKLLAITSAEDNKLLIVTEEETKMNGRTTSTNYSHNSFTGGMTETTSSYCIWAKSRNNFRITLIDSTGNIVKNTCVKNYKFSGTEFPYDVTPWSSPEPGASFKIMGNNLLMGDIYNATNAPPPANYFQAIKIKNAFGIKVLKFNMLNGDTSSIKISLSNFSTGCSDFFIGEKGIYANEASKGKNTCQITMFPLSFLRLSEQ